MTDVKPFARDDGPPPQARTVAVVLVASAIPTDSAARTPGLLEPMGPTCLFDRAVACLDSVDEATERAIWADDAALFERFERDAHPGVRLLAAAPERSLRPGTPDALRSTHVAVLDGRYPFLRPNTIDEAIRLLRLRGDIESLTSCLRAHGSLYDTSGDLLAQGLDEPRDVLVSCPAFSVVPAATIALGRALKQPAFPFEIGGSEGFRVDTPFTHELAGALLTTRA